MSTDFKTLIEQATEKNAAVTPSENTYPVEAIGHARKQGAELPNELLLLALQFVECVSKKHPDSNPQFIIEEAHKLITEIRKRLEGAE